MIEVQDVIAAIVDDLTWSNADEDRAAAHIIAAAPDMFEALQVVARAIVEQDGFGAAWAKIESALAKAQGIAARSGETVKQGSTRKGKSPVAKPCAQKQSSSLGRV